MLYYSHLPPAHLLFFRHHHLLADCNTLPYLVACGRPHTYAYTTLRLARYYLLPFPHTTTAGDDLHQHHASTRTAQTLLITAIMDHHRAVVSRSYPTHNAKHTHATTSARAY